MALFASTLVLTFVATVQTQDSLWNRPVVLPPDTTVVEVRQGIEYKRTAGGPLRMDVYRPRRRPVSLPAVVFVHGGPLRAGWSRDIRLARPYTSYGRLVASHGMVAVTFSHRLAEFMTVDSAALDVRDAMRYLVAHADTLGLDRNRICLWGISRGGLVLSPAVQTLGARLRCLVLYYAIVEPPPTGDSVASNPSPPSLTTFVGSGATFPATFVVRAGRDEPRGNAGLDRFALTAIRRGTNLDFLAYAEGMHYFDLLEDTARARQIIARTLEFIRWWTTNPGRRR